MRLCKVPRYGYMLRDLVACVAMMILFLGIALPVYSKKKEDDKARKGKETINNLRQLAVAVHCAVGDYKRIPPSGTNVKTGQQMGAYGAKTGSLYYHLLPYVEQLPMYNAGALNAYVPTYHAPSDPSENGPKDKEQATGTSFPFDGLVFNQGGNVTGKNLSASMPDGTSNCIIFATGAIQSKELRDAAAADPKTCNVTGTDLPQFMDWTGRANVSLFQAYDAGGIAVAMGDANTRVVSSTVSAKSWKAAMLPNDNNTPGNDF